MKAKKSYGQHFLKEESIAKKIVESLSLHTEVNNILEVGPGKGMLTKHLITTYPEHTLKVVEADKDMVAYLEEHYPDLSSAIIQEDFLKIDLATIYEEPFLLIGNYPYNISSQILFKMLNNKAAIPQMVGMFQKEVAKRVVAGPNNKVYGILSVLMQAFYKTEYLFTVKAGSFSPPPKVQSAVIRLQRKENYDDIGCDEQLFRRVVKTTFGKRRKMIRNTLKPFLPKDVLFSDDFFQKRPENLILEEFVELTNRIAEYN